MRHRLRKADRIRLAGKGNNKAQYVEGRKKKKWVGDRKQKNIKERKSKR